MWGFTRIEYEVNQLFWELFDVGAASLWLTYNVAIDLRKKLELLGIVLKSRGIDESKTFKRIHTFHDLALAKAKRSYTCSSRSLSFMRSHEISTACAESNK
jgi:hypothetical protein